MTCECLNSANLIIDNNHTCHVNSDSFFVSSKQDLTSSAESIATVLPITHKLVCKVCVADLPFQKRNLHHLHHVHPYQFCEATMRSSTRGASRLLGVSNHMSRCILRGLYIVSQPRFRNWPAFATYPFFSFVG